jgi:DNA-binding NarL/FixJ family response regulator
VNEIFGKLLTELPPAGGQSIASGAIFTEKLGPKIVYIEKRAFILECVAQSLRCCLDARVSAFPDLKSWKEDASAANLILIGGVETLKDPESLAIIQAVAQGEAPIVLLSDGLAKSQIFDSMRLGVSGCIPTTTSLEIAIEALRLVLAGGKFLPAESVLGELGEFPRSDRPPRAGSELTAREKTIAEALRAGNRNKQISHLLNLSESTVRVHIRNIMRKLNARNRTEVVVKLFDK